MTQSGSDQQLAFFGCADPLILLGVLEHHGISKDKVNYMATTCMCAIAGGCHGCMP